jgi:hypothetical protein
MDTLSINLEIIKLDEAAQPRVELDDEYIEELANDLTAGSKFPPVVVFRYGEDYHLADGFHRYRAHQKAGFDKIVAEIRRGDRREAIMHAVGANATHGKRRSNADKRKAAETLLKDEVWCRWTDRVIAEKCRVSQPLVSAIRKELTDNGYQFPEKRITANGRKMNVANIGSNRSLTTQESEISEAVPSEVGQQEASATVTAAPTSEDPEVNHQTEETQPAVNPEQSDDEAEASEATLGNQSDNPESPDSVAGDQPEEGDSADESPVEEMAEEAEDRESDQGPNGNEATAPGDEDATQPEAPKMDAENIDPLSQKVCDLEQDLAEAKQTIALKDERINELEEKIRVLEAENEYYRSQLTEVNDHTEDMAPSNAIQDSVFQAMEASLA